jgi:flagellar assembly protein FliH
MIIRDAVISEEARSLQPARSERSVASGIALAVREAPASYGDGASSVDSMQAKPAPPPPAQPILTFEAVAAWLAVQDGETRTACASLLADELTQVHENAKAEGLRRGEAAGLQKAAEASAQQLALVRALGAAAQQELERELSTLAEGCVDVVAAAFAKLAGEALVTRAAAIGAVEQVLLRVKEARELTVRVNSADVAALNEVLDALSEAFSGCKLRVVGDARVELGGCIVESKHGTLDGRFESQLRELFETLRAAKLATSERA